MPLTVRLPQAVLAVVSLIIVNGLMVMIVTLFLLKQLSSLTTEVLIVSFLK